MTSISRRTILRAAGLCAVAAPAARSARAAAFPTRPVHIAVTTAPGGTSDIVSRLSGQFLADRLGQPFIIDNKPGAGGNIATELVHRAPADGYTLLAITKGNVIANLLDDHLEFDFMRDFEPVAGIADGGLVLLIHPSVPATSLPEFLAWAKANPGRINYGSAGNGTDPHLSGELLKMMTGIEMTHVPYRGGALAFTDLLGGGVQAMFSNLPAADYIKEGKLRALGVTSARRLPDYPDVPTIAETVPGYEVGVWYGFVARRGSPAEAIETLNAGMAAALADPRTKLGLAALNATPMPMTPAELGRLFAIEIDKWGKVIAAAHIKP